MYAAATDSKFESNRGIEVQEPSGGRPTKEPSGGRPTKPFVFISTFKWEMRKGWDVLLSAYLEVR
jgi:hypothetical protein